MWILTGAVLLLFALYLFFIFPCPANREVRARFAGRAYAHRGLHGGGGPAENTLAAFRAAADAGYGIELDVQLTLDKQLVVFHDPDLRRACGDGRRVRDLRYDELAALPVFGSAEAAPLFSDVLKLVGGRVPLIVEIKSDMDRLFTNECCRILLAALKDYGGAYCVESFDPFAVRWFAVYAPRTVRGQLAMGGRGYGKTVSPAGRFMMSRLLTGILNRPHFIAYRHSEKGGALKAVKRLGAMSVVWTVTSQADHDRLARTEDGIIFEGYRPDPRF